MDSQLWENLYQKILEGDIFSVFSYVFEVIKNEDIFLNGSLKELCISLILLAVFAGIFSAFTDSLKKTELAGMSYFVIYVFLFAILLGVFAKMQVITEGVLNAVLLLMNAAIPIYYMAVVASGNYLSAYTYYRVSVLAIYVVEQLILHILLPVVSCYVILDFGNALWLEKKLSYLKDFLKKTVGFILKTLVGVVSGISFLQAMVSPSVDNLKSGTTQKLISMIPGIGNAAEGMTELTVGSLTLIKNSVGLCMFLMLLITAAIPVLKLFITGVLLKGCGALMSVISEKNFASPVSDTADAVFMLLKVVLAVLLLFVISAAIVLFTTNL